MSWNLYLDDERDPKTNVDWVVVRSSTELLKELDRRGLPTQVSLDHDLGLDSESGYICLRWLLDRWMIKGVDLTQIAFNVHSANPVGAKNMRDLFAGSIKAQERFGLDFFTED